MLNLIQVLLRKATRLRIHKISTCINKYKRKKEKKKKDENEFFLADPIVGHEIC